MLTLPGIKVSSKTVRDVDMVFTISLLEHCTMDNGLEIRLMEEEYGFREIVRDMMASGKIICPMDKGFIFGLISLGIKDYFTKEKSKAMVHIPGQMETNMLVCGKMV